MKLVDVEKGFVYCLEDKINGICRIGKTISKEGMRQKQQVAYLPFEVEVTTVAVDNHTYVERFIHKSLSEYRIRGDWFKISVEEFHKHVTLGKESLSVAIAETMNYHDKHTTYNHLTKSFPMESVNRPYKCEFCDFISIHKSLWDVHQYNCRENGNYYDACVGCKHCESFEKEIVKTFKSNKKEPRIIKSHGFRCSKFDKKMFPRLVMRNNMINSMPKGTFDGEVLMPTSCEHFENEIIVIAKLKHKQHES